MMSDGSRPPPRFRGVSTYRDELGRFNFRYPTDWLRSNLEGKSGIRVAPDIGDSDTWFTASVEELPFSVVAEDLEEIHRGVDEGLAQFADCHVEEGSKTVLGNLIRFDRSFTFSENGAVR